MPTVADAAVRREALDPNGSFIVQAPAGSGKTELLIQRYLVLLARVDHPESIVAITFTRKAAAEMRFRLIEALQRAVSGEPPAQEHARATWELARAALERDRALDWRLLQNPARLRILTIDALCLSLVRQMPWLSRLGAPPAPEENAEALYREAARATLDLLEDDDPRAAGLAHLLAHLDNNYAYIERLLVGMLGRRDQWLQLIMALRSHYADGEESAAVLRSLMEEQLAAITQQAQADAQQGLKRSGQAEEVVDLAGWAGGNVSDEGDFISPVRECAGLAHLPGDDPADLPAWLGITELLVKKDGDQRRSVTAREGFPPGARGKERKEQFKSLELSRSTLEVLHNLRTLPPARYEDQQWQVLAALFDVLPVAVVQLQEVFKRTGTVDFIEIAMAARTALGPEESPSDLAFALDYRIQHWLVDEFQDTSHSQFELLRALTVEWQPDDGRTIFLVGDPMQSIYAFRQAEVGLFLRARRYGLGHLPLKPLRLSVNFRSQAELVDWVNESFEIAFPAREDIARGAVTFERSDAFHPALGEAGPAVTMHAFAGKSYDVEAARVLEIIRRARERDRRGSIAVLVRSRSHLLHIAAALQQAGIRYRAVDIDPLQNRPVVQDLWALTQALAHPADRPAWLAILRAPWCGLQLADLLQVCSGEPKATVWDLLQRPDRLEQLPEHGQQRVARFCRVLERALPLTGRMPLARLIEKTWFELGGPACLTSDEAIADAEAFLDLLEDCSEGGAEIDLDGLQHQVTRLYAQPDPAADDSLQLMTIHKSKGLEFDTVILPGLGRAPRNEDASLLLWMDQSILPGRMAPLLAPIKEAGAEQDPLYRWVLEAQKRKREYEVTRLLYVAVTRARQHLHLLAHAAWNEKEGEVRTPDRRTLLARLWPQVEEEVQAQVAEQIESQPPERVAPDPLDTRVVTLPLRRLALEWQPPAPPPLLHWRPAPRPMVVLDEERPAAEPLDAERHALNLVLRHLLRRSAGQHTPAAVRALLRAEGVAAARLDAATQRITAALSAIEADPRGGWLLAAHGEAEWGLSLTGDIEGKRLQASIDRSFVDEQGARWLLAVRMEFQDEAPDAAAIEEDAARCRNRLEAGADLVMAWERSEGRAHPVRCGVYYPWLCAWREWAHPQSAAAAE